MRYLCFDIGNSRTKLAVFEEDNIIFKETLPILSIPKATEILEKFHPDSTILSSTAKENENLIKLFLSQKNFIRLSALTALPFKNAYSTPQTLGLDRIALAAASVSLYPGKNVLAIDAGTCITIDFTSADGIYLGGSIHPGIKMRLKAMHLFTGRLPLLHPTLVEDFMGDSTRACMLAGAVKGAAAEIDGFISHYLTQFPDLIVVLTGGDADIFFSMLKNKIFALPDLVLLGLQKIAQYNVQT